MKLMRHAGGSHGSHIRRRGGGGAHMRCRTRKGNPIESHFLQVQSGCGLAAVNNGAVILSRSSAALR